MVGRVNLRREEPSVESLADLQLRAAAPEMHQHHIARLRATEYQQLRQLLRNLARMHGLLAAYILHEVKVEPAVGHTPLLTLRHALANALVGRVLVRLGDLLLEKLVVGGLATV